MSTFNQQEYIDRRIAEQRKHNQPDLLSLWRAREEKRRLNEIRSFFRSINWEI